MAKNRDESEFVLGEQFQPDLFWETHRRKIVAALVVVAVVGIGLFVWQQSVATRAERASAALATAQDLPALEALARQYAGGEIGAQAGMRLAEMLFQQGRLDDAARQFETFLREYPSHPLGPSARLGLAEVEESRGNLSAAKNLYSQLATTPPNNYASLAARAGAARCLEATGQTNEARQAYEELMALTQGSPQRMDAYFRWTVLGRGMPRVAPTNAPAATMVWPALPGTPPAAQK